MRHSLDHPSSTNMLGAVRSLFRKGRIYYALGSHITFVCGSGSRKKLRAQFIRHVCLEHPAISVFRAEDALADLFSDPDPNFVNLSELEALIASAFDSVLIFPESPGSFAEVGYFSQHEKIRRKTLVAILDKHQGDSFLMLGPIATISEDSAYRPTIVMSNDKAALGFNTIARRLLRYSSERRKRMPFRLAPYASMEPRDRLFVVGEIVRIFRVIDVEGIERCLNVTFGGVNEARLRWMVSILVGAGVIQWHKANGNVLTVGKRSRAFLDFEHSHINSLQASIALYYRRHKIEWYTLLGAHP